MRAALARRGSELGPPTRYPGWSLRTRILARALQAAARRVTSLSPYRARVFLDALGKLAPPALSVRRRPALVGGVPCEWYLPAGAADAPVIAHIHGGGYALCSTSTHRMMVSDIASATGLRCLGVNYRLAPEHPYPAALEDCVAAYRGLLREGLAPRDVILSGDSAGAALAVAAMVRLRDQGEGLPRMALLLSPWPDLACAGETIEANAPFDYLSGEVMRFFADLYLQGADPRDGLASPVHADLSGLPPVLIHAGGAELLLSDIRAFAARLEEAGVDVTLEVWDGMVHAFHGFTIFLPEAREALRALGRYVRAGSAAS